MRKRKNNSKKQTKILIFVVGLSFGILISVLFLIGSEGFNLSNSRKDWCIDKGYECYGAGLNHDECGYYLDMGKEPWKQDEVCGKDIWRD